MKNQNTKRNIYIFLFLSFMAVPSLIAQGSFQAPYTNTPNEVNGCDTSFPLSAVTLNAPSGTSHRWYTSSSGTQYISTPTVVNTQGTNDYVTELNVTQTSEYWVARRNNSGQESSRTKVKVTFTTPDTSAPSLELGPPQNSSTQQCGPTATFNLGAGGGGTGSTYNWYGSSNTSGTPLHTGSGYTPTLNYNQTSNGSKTYWVKATLKKNDNCYTGGDIIETKTITVSFKSPVTPPTISDVERCGPGTVTFIASGSAGTYRWYNPSGNQVSSTNSTLGTVSLSADATYMVSSYVDGCESEKVAVRAIIKSVPSAPTNLQGDSTCGAGSVTLSASGSSGSYRWYSPNGSQISGETSNELTISNLAQTGTYKVSSYVNGCESTKKDVVATVKAPPADAPTTFSASRCGPGTITIAASGSSGSYRWYDSNGFLISGQTSANYVISNLTTSKTFEVSKYEDGCEGPKNPVFATIKAIPNEPTAPNVSRCGPGSITLTASGSLGSYRWYAPNGSQISGQTSSALTVSNLNATATYEVSSVVDGCVSAKIGVTATINPLPIAPETTGGENDCDSNVVTLTAVSTSTNVTHIWYTSLNGPNTVPPTTEQNNGAHVSTKNITLSGADISYWVAAERNGCIGEREEVKAQYVSTGSTPTITLADSSTSTERCGTGTFILTANITNGSSNNLVWYDGAGNGASQVGNGPSFQTTLDYVDMDNAGKKKFWVGGTLVNSGNCSFPMANRISIEVSLDPLPSAPTTTNAMVMRCGPGDVTLTANVNSGTIEWFDAPTGGNSQGTGNNLTKNITQNKTFYAESISSAGCRSAVRLPIEAQITTGIVWYPDEDGDNLADTLEASASQENCDEPTGNWTNMAILDNCPGLNDPSNPEPQIWYADLENNGQGDGWGDPNNASAPLCEAPAGYVGNSDDLCPNILSVANNCISEPNDSCDTTSNPPQFTGDNYVYTRTYQKSAEEMGISTTTKIPFFTENEDLIQQITYFDGLGRPIQQIGIDQAPDETGIGNFGDIITHMEYDDFGRMEKEFLPYATETGQIGSYRTDALSKTNEFYLGNDGKYENTTNPFSQKAFEPSPLNRVEKQAAPGADWALGNGHEIELEYLTNNANEVRLFMVDLSGGNENPVLDDDSFYLGGELYKNLTKDENHTSGKNHTTEEFTDKQGRVVLKRTYADVDLNKNNTIDTGETEIAHDTYYVYDDFGNLTYVLPPKMDANTTGLTDLKNRLNNLGYQYKYDYRNRLVEKRIPGKGKEYIIYNKLDQPIMTQDANQRANDEWLFTKYDAFGRVAYTGKVFESKERTQVQADANAITSALWVDQKTTDQQIDFTVITDSIFYDNGAYPTSTITEILTINYYDSYIDKPANAPQSITILDSPNDETNTTNVNGLATLSKVKVLDQSSSQWISTLTYYDEKARPVYTYSENEFLGTTDILETSIDFIGKPLKSRTTHTRGTETIVTIDNFTYDHTGRLLAQTQCVGDTSMGNSCPQGEITDTSTELTLTGPINDTRVHHQRIVVTSATLNNGAYLKIDPTSNGSASQELIAYNTYDNLGQLENKKVGGAATVASSVVSANGLQTVQYEYNVRGWLTDINDPSNLGENLFGFSIKYNDIADLTKKLYNGNISQTLWSTQSDNPNLPNSNDGNAISSQYTYSYDALNRITEAIDNTNHYDLSHVTYDKNGNIEKLKRQGFVGPNADDFGLMDDLNYTYYPNSNQLESVSDFEGVVTGFKDGNQSGFDYSYDTNGNMIMDLNKGILGSTASQEGIEYNHLNLPVTVRVNNGADVGTISYIYDATGVKLQKNVLKNGSTASTDYAGNYIYEKPSGGATTLQFFSTPEGYVEPKNTNDLTQGYNYIYQYKDHLGNVRLSYTGNNGIVEIVEENNYYPFGLKHKGYNGVKNGRDHKYGFGNKEEQDELGLAWHDFGARNYDASLGRWMNPDPLAEKYYQHSPYNYVLNSPLNYVDPYGMDVILLIWTTQEDRWGHAAIAVSNYKKDDEGNYVQDEDGNYVEDGTYTFYNLWPADVFNILEDDIDDDVDSEFFIGNGGSEGGMNKTLEDMLRWDPTLGNENWEAPDGAILFDTNSFEKDQKVKSTMEKMIGDDKKYNAIDFNCTDYCIEGIKSINGEEINAKEQVTKSRTASTPNRLFQEALKLKSTYILKNPGEAVNKDFSTARDSKTKN